LNDTVTDGNCPWWLIESASVVIDACVNALSGIAFAPTDEVVVFAVVPAVVPPLAEDVPCALVVPASTLVGAVLTPEEGVYFTELVVAFDPAEDEADEENDVTAPAPLAPEDALP
jgi:hypothetical protein